MLPDEFDYYRPDTLDEAIETLTERTDARILAGGYSLIPSMKTGSAPSKTTGLDPGKKEDLASPEALVDIQNIDDLRGIEHGNNTTRIGALTTYVTISNDEELTKNANVLREAAMKVGTTQVRNRGTIGGNVAYADPASDLPGAVLTADATVVVRGPDGKREISTDEFFLGDCETAVAEDEVITELLVPQDEGNLNSAYRRRTSPTSGYAVVGVGAALETEDGVIQSARVGANGLTNRAIRVTTTEQALQGSSVHDRDGIETAAQRAPAVVDDEAVLSDVNASAEYRQNLLEVYVEDAVTAAAKRAS